jgi:hypothetical protein
VTFHQSIVIVNLCLGENKNRIILKLIKCYAASTVHSIVSNGTVNYLAQILGDGDNNGVNMVIGFQTIDVSVPDLAAGLHR